MGTVEEIYRLSAAGEDRKAVAMEMDLLNDLLVVGKFAEVDEVLDQFDCSRLSPTVMVGALGITGRYVSKSRKQFWHRCYREIAKSKGCWYARGLLKKYR